jgi:hypothetical protein
VSVVARGCAEAAILMQTREDEFEKLPARKSLGMPKQMQRGQSPVEAVQTQVLGQPVLQLVFALARPAGAGQRGILRCGAARLQSTHCVEALDIADMAVDGEARLAGRVSDASAARPRYKRHVCSQPSGEGDRTGGGTCMNSRAT